MELKKKAKAMKNKLQNCAIPIIILIEIGIIAYLIGVIMGK